MGLEGPSLLSHAPTKLAVRHERERFVVAWSRPPASVSDVAEP